MNWKFWTFVVLYFTYVAAFYFLYVSIPKLDRSVHAVNALVFTSAFLGSLTLYLWENKDNRKVWIKKERLKKLLNLTRINDAHHRLMEMVLFVLTGAFVALCIVQPTTPMQALAAGLGWIGVASTFMSTNVSTTGSGGV